MFLFIHSLKNLKCIGNVYKHTRINNSHIYLRNLSHIPNNIAPQKSEPTNSFLQSKKDGVVKTLHIDNIIHQMHRQFGKTGVVPKSSIERIIQCVVETAGAIETSQALFTLRCSRLLLQCTPQERIKLVNSLWKQFNIYHIPINVSHYNALLKVYVENKYEFSPMEILATMKEQGILPNETTYKHLLEYHCKNGDMSNAETVLKCMEKNNYPINECAFNLLILGYSEASDLKNAMNILDIMKSMGVAPTRETYIAIMCAYAKVNDIRGINTILLHCDNKDIQFTNEQILDVIYTLIINNNMDHVDKMFSRIKTLNYPVEINFLSKVIDTKQDIAINIFLSILSKNKHEDTYNKLLHFFIDKLMHSNVCPENIINACVHLETKYNDKMVLNKAIYLSFQHNNDEVTSYLLKEWKSRGCKLRPHYFWPIFAKLIKQNNVQGLLHNVKEMITTYNVTPCVNTLTDYIIPYVFYNILTLRDELYKYGVPAKIIDNAIVYDFLKHNKMRRAASYMSVNKNIYEESILKDVLRQGLYNTYDIISFFVIIRNMYKDTEFKTQKKVCINEALLEIMEFLSHRSHCISQIIEYLYNNQLYINDDVYKALSSHYKDNSSSTKLLQLKSLNFSTSSDVMSLYRNFQALKEKNISMSHHKYIDLVNVLFKQNLREEGKIIIKYLVIDYPVISTLMFVLKEAKYLISAGYFNDAVEIIENTLTMIKIENNANVISQLMNLLKHASYKNNETEVIRLFNILLKTGYLQPTKGTMNLLILIYIKQGNAIKALEISELLCEKYQYIPALTQLTTLIVLAEDKKLLQRFIDVTTKVYELQYILGELLLCFLENNYEKEAKRIIEFLAASNYTFANIKENVYKRVHQKNFKILKKLLYCSVEYPGMNRFFIYKCLLHIYDITNNHQSALYLWTKLIEEGLSPTEDFVQIFTNLIERNNIDKSLVPINIKSF